MRKEILYKIVGLAAILVAIAIPFYYKRIKSEKPLTVDVDKEFCQHITAFTSGVVSNKSCIIVQLKEPVDSSTEEIDNSLFSFFPAIQGTTSWIDKHTVVFKPDKALPSGQQFSAKFYMGKLKKVPKHLRVLKFEFTTLQQNVHVAIGSQVHDPADPSKMQLTGILTTADFAPITEVEQVLSATQHGKRLPITWEHQSDAKSHSFVIREIQRTTHSEETAVIKWQGSPIGSHNTGEKIIDIPKLGHFKVMYTRIDQLPNPCVHIHFSDPVNENQDLEGLVHLQNEEKGTGERIKLLIKDNTVSVYPEKSLSQNYKLVVEAGVRNTMGYALAERFQQTLVFESIKPEVQLVGKGVILPSSQGLLLPFKAVNLSGVVVKIVKVLEHNLHQFLQINRHDQGYELKRVGRLIYKKTIPLNKSLDLTQWNTFSLDIGKLIDVEPGSFYRVYIGFNKCHSLYPCTCCPKETINDSTASDYEPQGEDSELAYFDGPVAYFDEPDGMNYWGHYDYGQGYQWDERDDPCKASYYLRGSHTVSRNVLASDLGIVAKSDGHKGLMVAVSDLRTTEPLRKVALKVYNLQQQILVEGTTDKNGMARLVLDKKPFLLVAQKGEDIGYLHLSEENACSLSMFDVDGQKPQKSLKGFIYGERDVWRPGDTLFLSFILEDKQHTLPAEHPVIFELYTPQNQLYKREVSTHGLNGFYAFTPTTDKASPTGNWTCKIKVGGAVFTKTVRIETIKPNRLKATLTFNEELLNTKKLFQGVIAGQWLHGASAKGLKADIKIKLLPHKTTFEAYPDYTFTDPGKEFYDSEQDIFEGTLDEEGKATFSARADLGNTTSGMVKANFNIRIFEKGGGFSVDRTSLCYSPYRGYVGFRLPKGEGYNDALYADKDNLIPIVTVDETGKLVGRKKVKIEIFALNWRWWFERSVGDNLAQYLRSNSARCLHTAYIDTPGGKATYTMNLGTAFWGRNYIRITDPETGHSAGKVFYTDYEDDWDHGKNNPSGAEMLTFKTDKKQYNVGEKVTVDLPAATVGKALVSIESGAKVLDTFWVPINTSKHTFSFNATQAMAPNVYIHITYLQPHNQCENDLPIRLYGVQPICVENPATHLQPVLTMPPVLAPEKEVTIKVSEKQGKKMTYTLAIVDEGLLGLTNFKTPAPWHHFYAREALGIKTWDMYQYVVGAFTGNMTGLLAVGGGDEVEINKAGEKANRFVPVVTYLAPSELKPGAENTHTFKMPNYVGAVKTMLVAGHEGAYGSCDKVTPVKQSLMVVATLPRVVGPQEKVKMPVTVFAMDDSIKKATVTIQPNELFEVVGSKQQVTSFHEQGDKMVSFDLVVRKKIGVGKIDIIAQSGSKKATYSIELDVRLPNPRITHTLDAVVDPGKTWETTYTPVGLSGTNDGMLEIASIPSLRLESRLQYLLQYPHGCVEQVTSAAFPQLFLSSLLELTIHQKQKIQANVMEAIQKLISFQNNAGGFVYWPDIYQEVSEWGTNYAGHFLLAAKAAGYSIPIGLLENWIRFQQKKANDWISSPTLAPYGYHSDQRIQAYRLYTLAMAGQPAMGAMNRLRSTSNLAVSVQWLLAATYHLAGRTEVALELVNDLTTHVAPYQELSYSYGSDMRDQAMILTVLNLLKRRSQAKEIFDILAKKLGSETWLSTQTTAYMLLAVAQFVGNENTGNGVFCSYRLQNKKATPLSTTASLTQVPLPIETTQPGHIAITNTGNSPLFIKVQLAGVPLETTGPDQENDLRMHIDYLDMEGNFIDPTTLTQGTDFMAEVHIHHPGIRQDYNEMALTHHFPAGWEIKNERLDSPSQTQTPTYQDIRDDRVLSYFDLKKHEKKSFRILLNAAYIGNYYLPTVYCEAMYDASINARCNGKWVKVVE